VSLNANFGSLSSVNLHSQIYYSILFLGIVAAGGIFVGTNPSYTPFELKHHLRTSQARFIITEPELLDAIRTVSGECKIRESNIRIFNVRGQEVPNGFRSWTELLQHGQQDWVRFNGGEISSTTTAAYLFSSGTTGLPKAAVVSHYNLIAQHTLAIEPERTPWQVRSRVHVFNCFCR
jgi:acyl-CoA synthetase (AMP-forming)/AMP-acid ligase II